MEIIKALFIDLLRVGGFIGLSYLVTKDVKASIGLGIILYLFWTKNNH